MSGIDEYILGACFIETKPKSLPWDDNSKDGREEGSRSCSKTSNDDNYLDEKVNTNNDNKDTCNQSIIDKGKAEDILTKITLGDLKLRDISFTSNKIKEMKSNSCTTNKISDVGLAEGPVNTKTLPYNANDREKNTYYKTTSCLNSENAAEMVKSEAANIRGTYAERSRHFYRPTVTDRASVGYNMNMHLMGYEKSLMHERSTCYFTDTDSEVLPHSSKVVKHDGTETTINGKTAENQLTTYFTGNENTDANGQKKYTDTGTYGIDFSLYNMGSKKESDLMDTGNKCYSTDVNLPPPKAGGELTNVKAESNIEQLRKEIDKEFSFRGPGNDLDISAAPKSEMRKCGSVGFVQRKTLGNERPMLTANVRASDLMGRKSRNERKTLNPLGKQCETNVSKPLSFDSIHKTQNVCQANRSGENKETTNHRRERNTSLDDKNLRKDDAISSATEAIRKRKKNQKLDKTKPKTIIANKLSDDDDVFDITPVKDTPWSPRQEESDDSSKTATKKSDRKNKNHNKKAKKSIVTAQNIKSENRMSIQKTTDGRSPIRQPSFRGIGCEITHTEKKLEKSMHVINVAPVRRDSRDISYNDRSNETSKALNTSTTTHRSDRFHMNKVSLVRVENDTLDSSTNIIDIKGESITKFPVGKLSLVRVKNGTLDCTPNIIDTREELVEDKHDSFSNDRDYQTKRRKRRKTQKR